MVAVSGTAILNSELTLAFSISVDGDYFYERVAGDSILTYEASSLVLEVTSAGDRARRDGTPPSGPDLDTDAFPYWGRYLIGLTMEKSARGEASLGRSRGRPALTWEQVERGGAAQFTVSAIVDEETLHPLSITTVWEPTARYPDGRTDTLEISELTVGQVSRALFRQGLGRESQAGSDQGFGLLEPETARTIASYEPILPRWVPEGFEFHSLAFASDAPWGAFYGPSAEVFVATYRHGIRAVTITTRIASDNMVVDPYCRGEGSCSIGERYRLSTGDFVDLSPAHPGSGPTHAWGVVGRLVLTLDGDVTVADLKQILDSLPLSS